MPTPILKINVDDEAFQRYLKVFQKYQTQLAEQPEMWGGVNDAIRDAVEAGAAMAATIEAQADHTRKLSQEESKQEESRKRASKRQEDEDKAQRKRDEDAATRRRHAIQQVKEYARNVADAAVSLGKWALIGQGASLAMGALSFWGLDRFVAGVGEERRLASGMGISMGQRQGMGLNMQRYFDVNSTLENVANMQANPGSWGAFRMMGINPQGKDPAELTYEAALAARRMFKADKGNLMLAQAQGLTQVFSPDDLRRMAAESPGEFKRSIQQGRRFQGLSDEVGRKWQDFEINLETAGLKIKNALIDKLTVLERNGTLDKLIQKFGDLALTVLDRIDFDKLGRGLDAFTKYISSPQFQQDFKTFIDDVGYFAHKMVRILEMLDLIPDRQDPLRKGTPGGPRGVPNESGVIARLPLGGAVVSRPENAKYVSQQLRGWGWDVAQTRGILSNVSAESGFNPFAAGDSGKAYGLAQWHSDRQAQYTRLFGHTMQSVTNRAQALKEQLEFLQWELTSSRSHFKSVGDKLKRTHSAFSAGYLVSKEYERPAGGAATAVIRGALATNITLSVKNQTGASVATTANSAAGTK